MKITDYRLELYVQKMDRAIGDANYPAGEDLMSSALLWIHTDEGISGIAPAGNRLVEKLFPLIEGEDPRGVAGLWNKMTDAVHKNNKEGLIADAISAIDVALWDLKAKIAGEPLWRTLGAREGRVKVYASDIGYNLSEEELFSFYSRMADAGVEGGKIKVGLSMEDDLRRIGVMREAFSKTKARPYLMIDSNEYWSPKQAVRAIHRIEKDYDLFWAEEPARRWDVEGLRQVTRSISAMVASGENLNGPDEAAPLIAGQAVDILNVGVRQSGITGAMKCANLAFAYEIPVTMMNCPANFMAHLAAALPNHSMMEVVDPGREAAFQSWDNHVEEGWILLGDTPGLGITINEDALQKLQAKEWDHEPRFPFSRREGAGLLIKEITPGEVPWKPA